MNTMINAPGSVWEAFLAEFKLESYVVTLGQTKYLAIETKPTSMQGFYFNKEGIERLIAGLQTIKDQL